MNQIPAQSGTIIFCRDPKLTTAMNRRLAFYGNDDEFPKPIKAWTDFIIFFVSMQRPIPFSGSTF
jgi:hypothetical protein